MAKFDAEMLKKHHFWFLLIFVGIGLLIAWAGLFWDVPGAIVHTKDEQDKKHKSLTSIQAKPRVLISKYSEQVKELEARRVNMWRQAWNEQKDLYFWPAKQRSAANDPFAVLDPQRAFFLDEPSHGLSERQLKVVADLKFGTNFATRDKESMRDQFRNPEIYEAAYKKVVADIMPMRFRDDSWQTILKYVPKWNQIPTTEEVWLAMEDLWIQREILMRIHQVNLDAAKFTNVTSAAPSAAVGLAGGQLFENPNRRVFRSRIWQLDIQLVDEGNKRVLKGSLKNITERLQVLGVGNILILKVWTGDPDRTNPYPFEIEGVSVPAGKTLPIKTIASHELPSEWPARGIFKVEQVFDTRTVPVKRIEHLAIGKLSDRNNSLLLRMAAFSEATAANDPVSTSGPGLPIGPTPSGPAVGQPSGPGAEGAPPVLNAATPQHQINRVRYVDVTNQLRRIPLGVVVVTDQSFMKDIIESIANTKMRFQTTQVGWSRFHHTLYYESSSYGSPPPSSSGSERGGTGPIGPMFGGLGSSGGPESTAQDQLSANLMELSIYGIISLYEKFDDPKGPPKTSTTIPPIKETPAVKDKEPAIKDKEPVKPMPKEKVPPEKGSDPKVPDPKAKGNDPKNPDPKMKEADPKVTPPAKP